MDNQIILLGLIFAEFPLKIPRNGGLISTIGRIV